MTVLCKHASALSVFSGGECMPTWFAEAHPLHARGHMPVCPDALRPARPRRVHGSRAEPALLARACRRRPMLCAHAATGERCCGRRAPPQDQPAHRPCCSQQQAHTCARALGGRFPCAPPLMLKGIVASALWAWRAGDVARRAYAPVWLVRVLCFCADTPATHVGVGVAGSSCATIKRGPSATSHAADWGCARTKGI